MDSEYSKLQAENIFLRIHPVHRMIISLVVGLVVFFSLPVRLNLLLRGMLFWDAFAYTLIALCWAVIAARSTEKIRAVARREDGSRAYVFLVVLLSCFASMIIVMLLILNKSSADEGQQNIYMIAAVAGMIAAWVIVHTTFTFHYAHMYYDDDDTDPKKHAEGLEFPSEKKPDYIDFAYFSFVIGMTFQVSDVEISARKIRRLVLLHGLLSFGLNTFVVALTVNLIAGLKG